MYPPTFVMDFFSGSGGVYVDVPPLIFVSRRDSKKSKQIGDKIR